MAQHVTIRLLCRLHVHGVVERRHTRRPSDRARAADIRAWATRRGREISERGRIPALVIAACEAGH